MSCPPRSASGFRKFSSCSDVLTSGRNQCGAVTVCCPNGPSSGYRGAGCFSSRSLCGVGSCVPRIANCHPVRWGNGYGGAGSGFGYCGPRYGYGDMCYGGYGNGYGFRRAGVCGPCAPGFPPIAINKNLLRPLKLEIDAAAPAAKLQEKEQLKSLNSKLATLIDKVQSLEQQNIVLKIKWGFLKRRKCCENHSKPMLDEYISTLKKQIEALGCERAQLEEEMKDWQEVMASNKSKFEEEYNQRIHAENEFIALKKDVDSAFMRKQELEAKIEAQTESLNLSRTVFEQELNELQSYILDTSVTVQMDNRRSLEMNNIIDEFRARYEEFASRSRAEADVWYQRQCQELRMTATKYNDKLSKLQAEISELIQIIQTLEGEISNAKAWHCKQEEKLAAAEERGETSVKDAQGKLAELEGARLKAKQDMARQLREYQELMNIKLALDIEIATYRKLLEGEEFRLGEGQLPVNISVQRNHGGIVCDTDPCYGEGHFSGCGSGNKPEGICSSTGVVCGANTGRNLSRSCGPPSHYTCETRRSMVASCTPRKDVCASRKDACVP